MTLFPTFGLPTRQRVANSPKTGAERPGAATEAALGAADPDGDASTAVASSVMIQDALAPLDRAADAIQTEPEDGEAMALGQEVVIGAGGVLQSLDLVRHELDHVPTTVADHVIVVLTAVQTAFIRLDSGIIDAALRPRERVIVGAVTAAVTLALSVAGTMLAGVAGLCVAVLAGRSLQSIWYPWLVARELRQANRWPDYLTKWPACLASRRSRMMTYAQARQCAWRKLAEWKRRGLLCDCSKAASTFEELSSGI